MGTPEAAVFRKYQSTHPWIRFQIDFNQCNHDVWMLLGEAKSKCDHISGIPLRPDTANRLYKVYLSKGVHATTAIEGNTLSEEEVAARIEGKLPLSKSKEYLGIEVDNIRRACNEIADDVVQGRPLQLSPERIKHFNTLVLTGLDLEEGVVPGECREHSVGVALYRGAPFEDCEHLLERMCDWLNGLELPDGQSENMQFALAVLKAIVSHVYLAWIHPFGEGNGRTARLIEVQLLLQSGFVPLPAAFILSNHYNQTRDKYYRELDKSSRTGGDLGSFIAYAMQGFVDGLREQLDVIRKQQWDVTWQNYVHDAFRDQDTAAARRRKRLVLAMPDDPVPRNDLKMIAPQIAADYANKGDKTLSRDLNALLDMGLMKKRGRNYSAAREQILAFLPPKSSPESA
ncbi:MAG: Fic family protein [Actinobacteria bacterium]|nr:Fic family protein [Actinomycetota bacterium]